MGRVGNRSGLIRFGSQSGFPFRVLGQVRIGFIRVSCHSRVSCFRCRNKVISGWFSFSRSTLEVIEVRVL